MAWRTRCSPRRSTTARWRSRTAADPAQVQDEAGAGTGARMKFAAILAVAATIVSGTAVAAVTRARVAVSSTAPATVDGTGFQSGERVVVTFVATEMYRKVVT